MHKARIDETEVVGVVVIGRNEGERLRRCLQSLERTTRNVVFVDSGSSDGSSVLARSMGVAVVELDMATPFTAARSRNAGFERLMVDCSDVQFVQFIDGDCELQPRWLVAAAEFLKTQPRVAIVSGRLRERHPDASVYNQLCDLEWDTPLGQSKYCGGIFMARVEAFSAVGGFRARLIAGEEPELCVRLRAEGWKVWRLHDEMALHDAAITRFSQWWRRTLRTGYAYAEGAHLHGAPPARHWVHETRSSMLWGAAIPATVLLGTLALGPVALLGLIVYPLQIARMYFGSRGPPQLRAWRALFLVVGKIPEAIGQLKFHALRLMGGGQSALIEYK